MAQCYCGLAKAAVTPGQGMEWRWRKTPLPMALYLQEQAAGLTPGSSRYAAWGMGMRARSISRLGCRHWAISRLLQRTRRRSEENFGTAFREAIACRELGGY